MGRGSRSLRCGGRLTAESESVAGRSRAGQDAAPVYGVATGFGPLAQVRIAPDQTRQLSRNLVLSSVAGVGPPLGEDIVRAMMLIRVNTFAKGFSGSAWTQE